jgi:hypothetical protein
MQQAEFAAPRLPAGPDLDRITRAYRLTLGRNPTPAELAIIQKHLPAGWPALFQSLFASLDFRYLN